MASDKLTELNLTLPAPGGTRLPGRAWVQTVKGVLQIIENTAGEGPGHQRGRNPAGAAPPDAPTKPQTNDRGGRDAPPPSGRRGGGTMGPRRPGKPLPQDA